jgi:hypothetical protein
MANPIKVIKGVTAGTKRAVRLIDKKLMNDPVPPKKLAKYSTSNKTLSKKLNKEWNTEFPNANKKTKITQKYKSKVTKSKNERDPEYLMGAKTVPLKKRGK